MKAFLSFFTMLFFCLAPPQIVQSVKNPPATQETLVGFLGREDLLEKG